MMVYPIFGRLIAYFDLYRLALYIFFLLGKTFWRPNLATTDIVYWKKSRNTLGISQWYFIIIFVQRPKWLFVVRGKWTVLLQDGEVSTEEFKKAVQTNCQGKAFNDMPGAFKAFTDVYFKTIDVDGNYSKSAHGV